MEPGITIATDQNVADLIQQARRELVVLAPAVTEAVANAIADRWQELGSPAVQVIVDSDPEVYRLGFGDEKGLQILEGVAREVQGTLRKQPGTRIAIVVSDGRTLIYTPSPRLIEAGPNTAGAANAIMLGEPPPKVAADLGRDSAAPRVGKTALTADDTQRIEKSLAAKPPQKFDIARRLRVFNAYFEFVELELLGTQINKQTIQIPGHILGVLDEKTRRQLRTNFRIVPDEDDLSGEHLRKDRDLIAGQFLIVIPKYGVVVKAAEKAAFLAMVQDLKDSVAAFGERLRCGLQASMDRQRAALVEAFLPRLREHPPTQWVMSGGKAPDPEKVRALLDRELKQAFGKAESLIRKMEVRVLFKGVTYEMLTSDDFAKACSKAGLDVEKLQEHFDVARAEPAQGDTRR